MFVTREVSQLWLSGWLKATLNCRGSQAGHAREVGSGGGGRAACRGVGATADWGSQCSGEQRTRNMEYIFVTREMSQLEMSALKVCMG